jgi:heme-degrading monooxygenase HmoA
MAITISRRNELVTFINVFTVEAVDQRRLVDLLTRAMEIVGTAEGFVSATLHRGVDGRKVAMYAQWRSVADYQAMRDNAGASLYLQEALTFAKFESAMYEVVETFQ